MQIFQKFNKTSNFTQNSSTRYYLKLFFKSACTRPCGSSLFLYTFLIKINKVLDFVNNLAYHQKWLRTTVVYYIIWLEIWYYDKFSSCIEFQHHSQIYDNSSF